MRDRARHALVDHTFEFTDAATVGANFQKRAASDSRPRFDGTRSRHRQDLCRKKIEATPVTVLRSHRIGEEIKALPVAKEPTCSARVATKGRNAMLRPFPRLGPGRAPQHHG